MESIPCEFEDRTFRYTQEWRHSMWAIYRQTHKESGTARFEVVRLHIQPAHTWPNGQTTPEKEGYPGASLWGRQGWTCFTKDEAKVLLTMLQVA